MSFSSQLGDFTVTAIDNVEQVFRGTCIGLFTRVIKRTPVKSGRLKGNWQTDINQPALGEVTTTDSTPINTIDTSSEARIITGVMRSTLQDTVFFTNNLPYASIVENGNYSTQAPQGMVKVSVLELEQVVQQQAAQL